jgi:metal-responsive CopG/Arc/MetJ family transcriptional regulator
MYMQGGNMHRTTILLPEDLKAKAEEFSRKKGLSLGEVVREAMRDLLNKAEDESGDSFLCDTAVYQGDVPKDLSHNHDEYLYGDKR